MLGMAIEIEFFPVDLPFSGNFLETIPTETASTAIKYGAHRTPCFMVKCADLVDELVAETGVEIGCLPHYPLDHISARLVRRQHWRGLLFSQVEQYGAALHQLGITIDESWYFLVRVHARELFRKLFALHDLVVKIIAGTWFERGDSVLICITLIPPAGMCFGQASQAMPEASSPL